MRGVKISAQGTLPKLKFILSYDFIVGERRGYATPGLEIARHSGNSILKVFLPADAAGPTDYC
jgi:hypothetical protein